MPTLQAAPAVPALLVTGDTYQNRHALRGIGARYDHDMGGYLLPLDRADALGALALPGLHALRVQVDRDPAAPETPEELRTRRNAARERRADRLDSQAGTQDRIAAQAHRRHAPYSSDYAFVTEPIKIGHHSEGAHRRLRARMAAAMDSEMEAHAKAQNLRDTAEHLRAVGAQVAGDAEARRQARRDAVAHIRVGDRVRDAVFGDAIVVRVNRDTFTIRLPSGSCFTSDKSFVTLIEAGAGVPVRPFKAGDRVTFKRGFWTGTATVRRVTPKGCSLVLDESRGARAGTVESFADSELAPIA